MRKDLKILLGFSSFVPNIFLSAVVIYIILIILNEAPLPSIPVIAICILLIIVSCILTTIALLYYLVDLLDMNDSIPSVTRKLIWFIVIYIFGIIGLPLYFWFHIKNRVEKK